MASWIMVMISPPSLPRTAQPRICPLSASTMAFMKPRVSPVPIDDRAVVLIGPIASPRYVPVPLRIAPRTQAMNTAWNGTRTS